MGEVTREWTKRRSRQQQSKVARSFKGGGGNCEIQGAHAFAALALCTAVVSGFLSPIRFAFFPPSHHLLLRQPLSPLFPQSSAFRVAPVPQMPRFALLCAAVLLAGVSALPRSPGLVSAHASALLCSASFRLRPPPRIGCFLLLRYSFSQLCPLADASSPNGARCGFALPRPAHLV